MKHRHAVAGAVVALWVVGCAGAAQDTATKAASPTDAEIAAIVVAANAVDADMGEFAAARAARPEVRQFGKTMASNHRAVNDAAGKLVAKLKVTPVENSISQKLHTDGAAVRAQLESKKGIDFDRAYMQHEVDYHKAVIAAVDEVLIPNADNAELKQTIVGVRPALVAHLALAQSILVELD